MYCLGAAWSCGLVLFVGSRGVLTHQIVEFEAPPATRHNVASWRYGPTLSASSFLNDFDEQQHPLFLADEVDNPSFLEKWSSNPRDTHPWVQVRWRHPITLSKVVLWHGSAFEPAVAPSERYTIHCLTGSSTTTSQLGPQLIVTDNQASVSVHRLSCADAVGVRVELQPTEGQSVVSLYELEAWGQ